MTLSAGAIVGIVIGSLLAVFVVFFLVYNYWWLPYRSKRPAATLNVDYELDEFENDTKSTKKLMQSYQLQPFDDHEAPLDASDDYRTTIEQNDPDRYFARLNTMY
jgi:hypothetical protein